MSTVLAPWPVCPPPYEGESLHSWFERVAAFYGLSAHRMLSSVARGLPKPKRWSDAFKVGITLAGNRKVARRLIALSGLSPSTLTSLRPARTGWELPRREFRAYCPRCCLEDLDRGETPYGRLVWQQAWYTVCRVHRMPLLLRRNTSGTLWKRHQLQQDASLAAALGYQHAHHPQRERFYIQYALLELQETVAHSVMASFHQDASDRPTAYRRTSRQEIKYAASPPAARAWLASRMENWPERYRSKCWLNPQS